MPAFEEEEDDDAVERPTRSLAIAAIAACGSLLMCYSAEHFTSGNAEREAATATTSNAASSASAAASFILTSMAFIAAATTQQEIYCAIATTHSATSSAAKRTAKPNTAAHGFRSRRRSQCPIRSRHSFEQSRCKRRAHQAV